MTAAWICVCLLDFSFTRQHVECVPCVSRGAAHAAQAWPSWIAMIGMARRLRTASMKEPLGILQRVLNRLAVTHVPASGVICPMFAMRTPRLLRDEPAGRPAARSRRRESLSSFMMWCCIPSFASSYSVLGSSLLMSTVVTCGLSSSRAYA